MCAPRTHGGTEERRNGHVRAEEARTYASGKRHGDGRAREVRTHASGKRHDRQPNAPSPREKGRTNADWIFHLVPIANLVYPCVTSYIYVSVFLPAPA